MDPFIPSSELRASLAILEFGGESQLVAPALMCLVQVSSKLYSGMSFAKGR